MFLVITNVSLLVKVGKHKGAEKADDLQSVARTTDPTVLKGKV